MKNRLLSSILATFVGLAATAAAAADTYDLYIDDNQQGQSYVAYALIDGYPQVPFFINGDPSRSISFNFGLLNGGTTIPASYDYQFNFYDTHGARLVDTAEVYATAGNTYFSLDLYSYLPTLTALPHGGSTLVTGGYQDLILNAPVSNGDSYSLHVVFGAVPQVPEPAAWSLMLLGVAGLGAQLRRRRAAVTA